MKEFLKKNKMAFVPLAIFLGLVGLFAAPLLEGKDPAVIPSAMLGKPVPAFNLPAALEGGNGISNSDFVGQDAPAVVNVFASWCLSCRVEQKTLELLQKETGVTLYGIDYKDKHEDAKRWLDTYGNPFTAIGFDAEGRSAIDWGVYGVPETFVIDKNGIIRYKHVGPITAEEIDNIFRPLLKELAKK
ncbi:MAG: DsbE family thiol:disulfide interchange protein [Micavibrio sp.]|nr:DsbE family thiol:disulfide interchange protein [Micavibrio sp.]